MVTRRVSEDPTNATIFWLTRRRLAIFYYWKRLAAQTITVQLHPFLSLLAKVKPCLDLLCCGSTKILIRFV